MVKTSSLRSLKPHYSNESLLLAKSESNNIKLNLNPPVEKEDPSQLPPGQSESAFKSNPNFKRPFSLPNSPKPMNIEENKIEEEEPPRINLSKPKELPTNEYNIDNSSMARGPQGQGTPTKKSNTLIGYYFSSTIGV